MPDALRNVDLGMDVIGIGPGPGFTTDLLAPRVERLTAAEVDEGLATSLRTRLSATNVEVSLGDATSLDLPDCRFTGAASFHLLHHIPTVDGQNRACTEMARVLRNDGVLVAADGAFSEGSRAFHDGDAYDPIDPGGLPGRLEDAGFRHVTFELHDLGWFVSAIASQ